MHKKFMQMERDAKRSAGEKLSSTLKMLNISQNELARRMLQAGDKTIVAGTVSRYCTGSSTPSPERRQLIAQLLDKDIVWLWGEE